MDIFSFFNQLDCKRLVTYIDFRLVPVDVPHDPDAPGVACLVPGYERQSRRLLRKNKARCHFEYQKTRF